MRGIEIQRGLIVPVAVVYPPPGMSAEQYKESWSGDERGGQPVPTPPGLLFHDGVGQGDDFFTVSVWENQEAYDDFAPAFKQAMAAIGIHFGTPSTLPVHHMIDP
jgi:hypothetical protein